MAKKKKENEIADQYGRVKGAPWFPLLHKKDIMVLGQGGIGSWVSLLLSRAGANLHIYDMDIYETHNMTGQICVQSAIGKNKAHAMRDLIKEVSPESGVTAYSEKYTDQSPTNDIVVCGFDNMLARKTAFQRWRDNLVPSDLDATAKKQSFFQDGRLLAEQLQIFNIPGDRSDLIEKYEKEFLFDDSEVQEAECTFKQTSHVAAIIAGHMVGFLTNWITNAYSTTPIRQVPFKYEYLVPLNLRT